MDSPSAPAIPDPTATAAAQGVANDASTRLTTTLNRPDQVTPYGTLSWSQPDAANPDKWTSSVQLSPAIQSIIDSQLATKQGLQGVTGTALTNVNNAMAQPIDYGALPGFADTNAIHAEQANAYPDLRGNIASQQELVGQGNSLTQQGMSTLQNSLATPFNYDNTPGIPQANEQTRQNVADALYGQARSRLDPQFGQQEAEMRSRLMNAGIPVGSQAWQQEMDNASRAKNDAYASAQNSSQISAINAMQSLFGMGLAGQQQAVSQENMLAQMPIAQAQAAASIGGGQTGNLLNLVQGQNATGQAADAAAALRINEQNASRGQVLSEEQQKQVNALNILNALQSSQQVQNPTFNYGGGGGTATPAPYAQSAYNSYQGALGNYQADVGSNNAMMGGMASVAAAAAPYMMMAGI